MGGGPTRIQHPLADAMKPTCYTEKEMASTMQQVRDQARRLAKRFLLRLIPLRQVLPSSPDSEFLEAPVTIRGFILHSACISRSTPQEFLLRIFPIGGSSYTGAYTGSLIFLLLLGILLRSHLVRGR